MASSQMAEIHDLIKNYTRTPSPLTQNNTTPAKAGTQHSPQLCPRKPPPISLRLLIAPLFTLAGSLQLSQSKPPQRQVALSHHLVLQQKMTSISRKGAKGGKAAITPLIVKLPFQPPCYSSYQEVFSALRQ